MPVTLHSSTYAEIATELAAYRQFGSPDGIAAQLKAQSQYIANLETRAAEQFVYAQEAAQDLYAIHVAGRNGCSICKNIASCPDQGKTIGKCDLFKWRWLRDSATPHTTAAPAVPEDYISRQALESACRKLVKAGFKSASPEGQMYLDMMASIRKAPAVPVATAEHAKMFSIHCHRANGFCWDIVGCTACGYPNLATSKICCQCGASFSAPDEKEDDHG